MNDLHFERISSMAALIKNKDLSPVELTKSVLSRIQEVDPVLNAYIRVMDEEAVAEAQQLEEELMQGSYRGPLHGIPIAIKDILETKGQVTTCGSKIFEDWVPQRNATVIDKLKHAGAILIGKANLHEFAMGATTENPTFGNCHNPWDLEKIPGGSSGGSAVAVASGMAYGAIGTDTAGSIRLPAALTGIIGLKPTYGLVSKHGCLPFSWSLDHIGPMTRYVEDAAIMLAAIADHDPSDPASCQRTFAMDLSSHPWESLKGVRLGVCREYFFDDVDDGVQDLVNDAVQKLKELGAHIVEVDLAGIQEALQALKVIAQSEVLTFHQPILDKCEHLYGEDLRFRFNFGSQVTASEYLNAQRTRKQFIQHVLERMSGMDALIAPTNSRPPFTIDTVPPHEAINNMFTLGKTPPANILGFPALTVPCGLNEDQLPAGIQLIGKPFSEQRLFDIARVYEQSESFIEKLKANHQYVQA